ncbi:MAG: methionine synthase [Ruminiclostridium sp.]|nr:methionine synthase [Ruminiclostridium sp.]
MEKNHVFQHLQVPFQKSLIYTRLGYAKTKTVLEPHTKSQIEKWITQARGLCDMTVVYRILPVIHVHENGVQLAEGIEFPGKSLARLLMHSTSAVLMAATSGHKITDEIQRLQQTGEMSKALVYDAAASEITDAGLDWLAAFIRRPLTSQGQSLTHMRFSPGYGDLGLENQQTLVQTLELDKWGVKLTESYILTPEKTVTAIMGIEAPSAEVRWFYEAKHLSGTQPKPLR